MDECGCPGDVPGAVKTAVLFKKRKKSFSFFFSHLFAGKLREYRERERETIDLFMHNTNCITVCVKVCAHVRERESLLYRSQRGWQQQQPPNSSFLCSSFERCAYRLRYAERVFLFFFPFHERKKRRKGNARDVSFFFSFTLCMYYAVGLLSSSSSSSQNAPIMLMIAHANACAIG